MDIAYISRGPARETPGAITLQGVIAPGAYMWGPQKAPRGKGGATEKAAKERRGPVGLSAELGR